MSNTNVKTIEIENEGIKYICKIKIRDELIIFNIYSDNELKYISNIFIEKIQIQIKAFLDYNINTIYEEIIKLNNDSFSIVKENNNNKLKIKFIILNKDKYLNINLYENKNVINEDIIDYYNTIIKEKENIILKLNDKITLLQNKLKNTNNIITNNNNNLYNEDLFKNFNIKLKNPIHILNNHNDRILCLTILNDGRIVSGSRDNSIIIYNKITYHPDLIIKEHNDEVCCIIQLSSGILASCSLDNTIKLFNLNNYKILQTLNFHKNCVYNIIELKNKYLVSCSNDQSIIFYYKNNFKYIKDYQILTNGACHSIIETKENEICYSESKNNTICFYNLNEKKIISSLSNISKINYYIGLFLMINKDLLLIPGNNKLSIIDINQYKLIKIIDAPNSGSIYSVCMLNKNILLTGDKSKRIRQWRIEGDNLILIFTKENAHDGDINALIKLRDGHIASCSDDKKIKIW